MNWLEKVGLGLVILIVCLPFLWLIKKKYQK